MTARSPLTSVGMQRFGGGAVEVAARGELRFGYFLCSRCKKSILVLFTTLSLNTCALICAAMFVAA